MTTLTLSKAINEGLRKALEDDPKVVVMVAVVAIVGLLVLFPFARALAVRSEARAP